MDKQKRKSKVNCSVVDCENNSLNSPQLQFYRFPTSNQFFPHKAVRREIWVTAVRRQESDQSPWQPTQNSRICGAHFIGGKKSEDPRNPSYNPTIFPDVYKKLNKNTEAAIHRYERRMKRVADKEIIAENSQKEVDHENNDFSPETENPVGSRYQNFDKQTQVDFLADNTSQQQVFLCNRFIYVNQDRCDAETQADRPRATKSMKNSLIHNAIRTEEKQVQTDTLIMNSLPESGAGFRGLSSIKSNREMLDLAGVTQNTYKLLLKILLRNNNLDARKKVSQENRLLIFLIKMKTGLTFSAISVMFAIHRSTVSRIFYSTLDELSIACKNFVTWPSRQVINATMPPVFRDSYQNCRVIIDCTEFRVEQPPTIEQRVQFYSHYKKGFRLKILVGCTPCGLISLVSKAYGGRATDAQITNGSGILELLEPGDVVLADKGFPQIKTILDESGRNILLVMPPFLYNNTFTEEQVEDTYKVASVRIHIERIMQRLRTYKILDFFVIDTLPYCDKIIFMCCVLVNLQPPIFKQSDSEEDGQDEGCG